MSEGTALIVHAVTTDNGAATALRLAADGFNIAICDIASRQDKLDDLARSVASNSVQCSCYTSDVTKEEDIVDLLADVVKDFGGLDVLVIAGPPFASSASPLADATTAEWDDMFALFTRSYFLLYKHAAQQMIKQGRGGRIVSANHLLGQQVLAPHVSVYAAAAFAVRGLTQTAGMTVLGGLLYGALTAVNVALELGPHNITVNSFARSLLGPSEKYETGQPIIEHVKSLKAIDPYQYVATRTPLRKKFATGDDIAQVVSLLASNECDFMTGQTIAVNGGLLMS